MRISRHFLTDLFRPRESGCQTGSRHLVRPELPRSKSSFVRCAPKSPLQEQENTPSYFEVTHNKTNSIRSPNMAFPGHGPSMTGDNHGSMAWSANRSIRSHKPMRNLADAYRDYDGAETPSTDSVLHPDSRKDQPESECSSIKSLLDYASECEDDDDGKLPGVWSENADCLFVLEPGPLRSFDHDEDILRSVYGDFQEATGRSRSQPSSSRALPDHARSSRRQAQSVPEIKHS
jgi:hypothetical protein